jgi:molybdate transport system substrate-binding protein
MNNGSSGALSVQIELGGNCDVFLAAGEKEMDRLDGLGLVDRESRVTLLSNQLVVIVPSGEGAGIEQPDDLASDAVRLVSIANPDGVPAGRYARIWLQEIGLWDRVEERMLPATNARSALAAVESGGAEAGVVYRTDAAISARVEVVYAVPLAQGPPIRYPVAAMLERPRREQSLAYIAHLRSDKALEVFRRHGFLIHEEG